MKHHALFVFLKKQQNLKLSSAANYRRFKLEIIVFLTCELCVTSDIERDCYSWVSKLGTLYLWLFSKHLTLPVDL